MSVAHKWSPIEDIPDAAALSDGELPALIEVWRDQGGALAAPGAVSEFSEKLNREWAIETGIIEGAYTLDRGTTQTLIEEGIKASLIDREKTDLAVEKLTAILQDHLGALEMMFAFIKGERELTVGFINELHAALLRHVETHWVEDSFGRRFEKPLAKGVRKVHSNSPRRIDGAIHEYCPPEHVDSEMDRLVEVHRKHVQAKLASEVQAAWLHHAFTQIHPFADGNGRVARTLASLVFVKGGAFPLVIRRDDPDRGVHDRSRYIEALERADRGDLRPLVDLFARAERRFLLGALQALPQRAANPTELSPRTPEEAISGIRDLLVSRGDTEVIPKDWEAAGSRADEVRMQAEQRLNVITNSLRAELGRFKTEYRFSLNFNPDKTISDELEKIARTAAEALGYELNLQGMPTVRELRLQPPLGSRIVYAVQGVGKIYRGVLAGVLVFVGSDGKAVSATEEIFQLNYKDVSSPLKDRFSKWLDAGLTRALEMWRAQI